MAKKLILNLAVTIFILVNDINADRGPSNSEREHHEHTDPKLREFDLELFKGLRTRQPGVHNLVFSPASIRTVLAMLRDGSAGATRTSLDLALGETSRPTSLLFPRSQNDGLEIANALFLSSRLVAKESYQRRMTSKYGAWLEYSDFSRPRSAADKINEWVTRATKGHVEEIVNRDTLSPDSVLLLANAVHLHGKWSNPFPEGNTKFSTFYEGFYASNRSCIEVPIMSQYNYFRVGLVPELKSKVLEMPFQEPEGLSMLVVLPLERGGLLSLLDSLEPDSLKHIYAALPEPILASVMLPRFTAITQQHLNNILPRDVARVLGSDADLSQITQNGGKVSVSQALHKASLSVDEKGAVGTAVSAVTAILLHSGSPFEFHATHPFVYMIVDKRDAEAGHIEPVFMGYVTTIQQPTGGEEIVSEQQEPITTPNPTRIYFNDRRHQRRNTSNNRSY